MFFKFTFVFTWLKLSVKKGSKQNKTKKNKDRYSATTSREAEYRIPFSKGTNSYFFSLIRWNKFASD